VGYVIIPGYAAYALDTWIVISEHFAPLSAFLRNFGLVQMSVLQESRWATIATGPDE